MIYIIIYIACVKELTNQKDCYAMSMVKNGTIVGHLLRKIYLASASANRKARRYSAKLLKCGLVIRLQRRRK